MFRSTFFLIPLVIVFTSHLAHGAKAAGDSTSTVTSTGVDPRQLVEMPEQARQFMREDMLEHTSALNAIIGYLAVSNLDAAAEVAESKMGESSMGEHRASGMGPGRFMPLEMRKIGWGMHEAASEFARIAKKGDLKSAYSALQKVTSACVACHYSYRTR